jgi:hypothetical protein
VGHQPLPTHRSCSVRRWLVTGIAR